MAVSSRAGLGELFIWGATPGGAGPGSFPLRDTWRCGRAGSREDFAVGGGHWGCARRWPETPREFSLVPGAAEERTGPGQDRTLSLLSGCAALGGWINPHLPLPYVFHCHSRGGLIIITYR